MGEQLAEQEHRVTPLELFFDLVFVFAFTQVTTLLSDRPTWGGLGRALLVLGVLWWAWASYAWLTNAVDAEQGALLAALLVAIAAMFIAALAVPDAFGRHRYVFAVAYLIVLLMHLALFAITGRRDRDFLAAIRRLAPWPLTGAGLILAAAFIPSGLRPALWAAALVVGFVGPLFTGVEGWQVQPAHFAERHGLIVIIAVGEAVIAIGIGARNTGLGAGEIVAAVLGLVVGTSFWLGYFDFFSIRAQQLVSERSGTARIALARDVYTYLHLPMIAGIVLFAFAMKETLAHVGDVLGKVPAVCLCEGSALYLSAFVLLRYRVSRQLRGGRFVCALVLVALLPVALHVPAIAALALVAAAWICLHAYELIWWREARTATRALRTPA